MTQKEDAIRLTFFVFFEPNKHHIRLNPFKFLVAKKK